MRVWWIRNDPCGMFAAILTVFLILFSHIVVIRYVLLPWYGFSLHAVIYTILCLLALASHTLCQYHDPGSVPRRFNLPPSAFPQPQPDGTMLVPKYCSRCQGAKPKRAHHCSICTRCVLKMDHHCPWVNNCVAINNQKYFILFLWYTFVSSVYTAALLIARFVSCTTNIRHCSVSGGQVALYVLNFVEALVFGLFCAMMLYDQLSAIFENLTGIESLKKLKSQKLTAYQALKLVFGESLSYRWFLPLPLSREARQLYEQELLNVEFIQRPPVPPSGTAPAAASRAVEASAGGAHEQSQLHARSAPQSAAVSINAAAVPVSASESTAVADSHSTSAITVLETESESSR